MLIARAARIAKVPKDTALWTIIRPFAHREKTGASVGEKAVLVLNAKKR